MDGDLWDYLVKLTPAKPFTDSLKPPILVLLSKQIRNQPHLCPAFLGYLSKRATHQTSSQVRFLTLLVMHYIFMRSMHFRQSFLFTYYMPFLENFFHDLPPPISFAERTKNGLIQCVDIWAERFGKIYPCLNILKIRFPKKITLEKKLQVTKLAELDTTFVQNQAKYRLVLTEMKNLVKLMETTEDKSEEFEGIIKTSIKENRKFFEQAINDYALLQMHIKQFAQGTELEKKIDQICKENSELQTRAQISGIDEDEFEEVDSDN